MAAPTARQQDAIWRLHLDVVAAEVVAAFAAQGIRAILIKGPSVANWLYGNRPRRYADIDLLVSPADFGPAEAILAGLGFGHPQRGAEAVGYWGHSHTWTRGVAHVDLHWRFPTIDGDPAVVWAVLSADTERQRIGGADIEVLAPPGRALLVALHAAHHGVEAQPLRDLCLAIETLPADLWDDAAALARRLDCGDALGVALRLVPGGDAVADRLGLASTASLEVVLQSYGNQPMTRQLSYLLDARGITAKARLVARQLVPTPTYLRAWHPIAARGVAGLAAAYAWRPLRGLWRTPSGVATVVRARRQGTR